MQPGEGKAAWSARIGGARRQLPGWLAFVLAAAVLVLALGGLRQLAPEEPETGYTLWTVAWTRAVEYLLIFVPLYACALASIRLWEERAQRQGPLSAVEATLAGLFVGIGGFAGVLFMLAVSGGVAPEQPFAAPGWSVIAGVLIGGLLLAFQSGAEECFFRGWLQPILCERWGVWPGLILASALFAGAHFFLVHGFVARFNVFLAGLVFGLLALRTGSVWSAVAGHWAWNFIEQSVVGLTPNPGIDALGSLTDLKLVGRAALVSGSDELTGTAAVTAILAVIVVAMILLPGARLTSSASAARRSGRAP